MFFEGTNTYTNNNITVSQQRSQEIPTIMPMMIWTSVEGVHF